MEPTVYLIMWETIGTILAAIVALLLGGGPVFYQFFIHKPKIKMDIISTPQEIYPDRRNYDIKYENTGPETAKDIRFSLRQIEFHKGQFSIGKIEFPKGVNIKYVNNPIHEKKSLHYGEINFCTILSVGHDNLVFANESFSRQNINVELILTGDNFKPVKKAVVYIDSPEIYEGRLEFVK